MAGGDIHSLSVATCSILRLVPKKQILQCWLELELLVLFQAIYFGHQQINHFTKIHIFSEKFSVEEDFRNLIVNN